VGESVKKLALAGAIVLLAARPVLGYKIGIFADSTATTCSLRIDQWDVVNLWVVVVLDGGEDPPIIGAHFSIRGFPGDWSPTVGVYPLQDGESPDNSTVPRVLLGYYEPHHPTRGILPLAKVGLSPRSQVGPTRIWIDRGESYVPSPPSLPSYDGPVLILEEPTAECQGGSPRYVPVVVTGLSAMINGPCSTAVQPTTWQHVKSLYRE